MLLTCGIPLRANVSGTPSRGMTGIHGENFRFTLARHGAVNRISCVIDTGVTAGGGRVASLSSSGSVVGGLRGNRNMTGCVLQRKRSVNSFCNFRDSNLCARRRVSTKRCCACKNMAPGTNSAGFIPRQRLS